MAGGKSIFEFADMFGVETPFDNWIEEQNNSKIVDISVEFSSVTTDGKGKYYITVYVQVTAVNPNRNTIVIVCDKKPTNEFIESQLDYSTFVHRSYNVVIEIPALFPSLIIKVEAGFGGISNSFLSRDFEVFKNGSIRKLPLGVNTGINAQITREQLLEIAAIGVSAKSKQGISKYVDLYLEDMNKMFEEFKINTPLRIAHFLAQVLHESSRLRAAIEGAGVKNPDLHDGYFGRGLIQLTKKDNYLAYERYCGEIVTGDIANRSKLATPPHAVRTAGWFWTTRNRDNLNNIADQNDFIWITRVVNGGFNGVDDRTNILRKAFSVLGIGDCNHEFSKSHAYNEAKASFAWGLWHDPELDYPKYHIGCTKNLNRSKEGYLRFIALTSDSFDKDNWYNIENITETSAIKRMIFVPKKGVELPFVNVRKTALLRIKALQQ